MNNYNFKEAQMLEHKKRYLTIYFIINGFLTQIFWNSYSTFTDYFNLINHHSNVSYLFSMSFGGLLSYIFYSKYLQNWSKMKLILFSSILLFVSLNLVVFVNLFFVEFSLEASLVIFFYAGFFAYIFQGLSSGIATKKSANFIKCFNIGTAVSGISVSITGIILELIFKTKDLPKHIAERAYRKQIFIFMILYLVFFCCYFLSLRKSFDDILDIIDEEDVPAKDEYHFEKSSVEVVLRNIDINMGVFIMVLSTSNLLSVCVISAKQLYNPELNLNYYFLSFSFLDFIFKSMPVWLIPKSFLVSHTLVFGKLLINVFFIYIIWGYPVFFLNSIVVRIGLTCLSGALNGYLKNSFMVQSRNRFIMSNEKQIVGYYFVLFVLLGILIASFLGVLLRNTKL